MLIVTDAIAVTNELLEVFTEIFNDHDGAPHQCLVGASIGLGENGTLVPIQAIADRGGLRSPSDSRWSGTGWQVHSSRHNSTNLAVGTHWLASAAASGIAIRSADTPLRSIHNASEVRTSRISTFSQPGQRPTNPGSGP